MRAPPFHRQGLTLVELCLVMTIIGLVTTMAVRQFGLYLDRAAARAAVIEAAAVVARARIRALAARRRGAASAFVAGRLLERQVARRADILRRFPKRWRKLEKRGLKAWR